MIRQHYEGIRRENTRVVVLWEGEPLVLHSLMRRYQGMIFLSLDYYERYQKKLMLGNMILLDWHQPAPRILEYI